MIETQQERQTDVRRPVNIVDGDVHLYPRSTDEFYEHMPEPWRSNLGAQRRNPQAREAYLPYWDPRRMDSYGDAGLPAGSDPGLVHEQLFRDAAVDYCLAIPSVTYSPDPDLNAAIAETTNTWLAANWLDTWSGNGRIFGSISVSPDNPRSAVDEIQKWADHPLMKQVLIGNFGDRPLGLPQYECIWAAAAQHDLPVAMHFTSHGSEALGATPTGPFQRYVDYHAVSFPLTYSAHLLSWLSSGIFDRLPNLKFVFVEGGFLWHRPLIARLRAQWKLLGTELALQHDDPFHYVRNHVRFTTQPIEESDSPREVAELLRLADAEHILMFSSDYPHYDYDDPSQALPHGLDEASRRRIMCENALDLYDLPATRLERSSDLVEVRP